MSGAVVRKKVPSYIGVSVDLDAVWNLASVPPRKRFLEISLFCGGQPHKPRVPPAPLVEHRRMRPEVIVFGLGLLLVAVGLSGFLLGIFLNIEAINILSSLFLVLGSAAVALSLLRGQDLDKRDA